MSSAPVRFLAYGHLLRVLRESAKADNDMIRGGAQISWHLHHAEENAGKSQIGDLR